MVLLLTDTITGSLAVVEMLAILAFLKIKVSRKVKSQPSLATREAEVLSSSTLDPTNIVNIARYFLEMECPISSNPEKWEAYRLYLQESLENYLHSAPRLPNLSSIETTEYYLQTLIAIVKNMFLLTTKVKQY